MSTAVQQADPLVEYVRDFLTHAPPVMESVMAGVSFVGDFALVVLDRNGPFQAQLTLCKAGAEIKDHGHPNVDSVVMYVTGEIYFRLDGPDGMITVYKPGDIHEIGDEFSRCSHHGKMLRVLPGQKHGATIGELGGAFITFQAWLDGEPRSVEEDWDGPPLDHEHAKKLNVAYQPPKKFEVPVAKCRELDADEVRLCIEGGKSFFAEGKIPGGFDPDYFCKHWAALIRSGNGVIIGSFDGETITGAIGAVVCPGYFSAIRLAVEGFWYVIPQYRKGTYGLRLKRAFELWADRKGVDFKAMIHLWELQPERLGELYESDGYRKMETVYIKEARP